MLLSQNMFSFLHPSQSAVNTTTLYLPLKSFHTDTTQLLSFPALIQLSFASHEFFLCALQLHWPVWTVNSASTWNSRCSNCNLIPTQRRIQVENKSIISVSWITAMQLLCVIIALLTNRFPLLATRWYCYKQFYLKDIKTTEERSWLFVLIGGKEDKQEGCWGLFIQFGVSLK